MTKGIMHELLRPKDVPEYTWNLCTAFFGSEERAILWLCQKTTRFPNTPLDVIKAGRAYEVNNHLARIADRMLI